MRTYLPLLLLLLLPACDGANSPLPIDAKSLLSGLEGPKIPTIQDEQTLTAQKAEKQGNYPLAIQTYQQMLEKKPNDNVILQNLADSLRRGGQYDKAISAYDELIKRDAKNVAAKEGKGLALMAKGDFESPTPLFQEVLKEDANRWKTLNALGILFVTRGLYPEAQQYFQAALKQQPPTPSVLNNLGLTQALSKRYPEALDTLSKAALQSDTGSIDRKRIDLNLALVYAISGKIDDARRIAETHLTGAALSNNLGLYAHLAKDDELAKSYLNMALTESKTYYAKAWDNLETLDGGGNNSIASSGGTKKLEAPAKKKFAKPIAPAKPVTLEKPAPTSTVQPLGGDITVEDIPPTVVPPLPPEKQ